TWAVTVTMPIGQRGFALMLIVRESPTGRSDGSSRACAKWPPGDELMSLSPQNWTADLPTFLTLSVPVAREPNTKLGRLKEPISLRRRGPGTLTVTKAPIWLITLSEPALAETGVT